jgi:hypothetical protein
MNEEHIPEDGIYIGASVVLSDGRSATISDLYFKGEKYFAEVEFSNGFKLTGVPIKNITVSDE